MSYTAVSKPRVVLWGSVAVAAVAVAATAIHLTGALAAAPASTTNAAQALPAPLPATATSAPPAPTSAPTTPSASTSVKPPPPQQATPKGGWIPVDRAAWQRQVDRVPGPQGRPGPGRRGRPRGVPGRLHVQPSARRTTRSSFPGCAGASHMHSFVGNKAVDADTEAERPDQVHRHHLQAGRSTTPPTGCRRSTTPRPASRSRPRASGSTTARSASNSTGHDADPQRPAHDRRRREEEGGDAARCAWPVLLRLLRSRRPRRRGAQQQRQLADLRPRATPRCTTCCSSRTAGTARTWTAPTTRTHVAYGTDNGCPSGHPVRIPALTFDITYRVKGTAAGLLPVVRPDRPERLVDARRRVPDVGHRRR